MVDVCIHFSEFFQVSESVIEDYGAFNVALVADTPVFIDPFCLYASDDPHYNELHNYIIRYLCFLKEMCIGNEILTDGEIENYFHFPEVKQLYMGFSKTGNNGRGLGKKFARMLQMNFSGPLASFGLEKIPESSHLEKLCIVGAGVGCDCISDFTANLLRDFLMTYTEKFARQHLKKGQCAFFGEKKAIFDFEKGCWRSKRYYLPKFNGSYVLLAPCDILTRDETWINHRDLLDELQHLPTSIGNESLRAQLEELLLSINLGFKRPTIKERNEKLSQFVLKNAEIIDWYIKSKEGGKTEALLQARDRISETTNMVGVMTREASHTLDKMGFYDVEMSTIEEARLRIRHFKQFVEDNDGYKLFFDGKGNKAREEHVQLAFKLLWYASKRDANREVNNGQGPADFVISFGNGDKCVIEIKWASNNRLRDNLLCQTEKYARANGTMNKLSMVLYCNKRELSKAEKILQEEHLTVNHDVFLIDATPNRKSASRLTVEDISFPNF